ncbi:MAG: hypothetical protein OEN02_07435 [Gammaproteobacteria bacterium]|nr:hypothetical protein [Gammaproteobacteria bacterium]MDH3537078.1 hypothetical protein [Gammaproteobacteria bacterium]
MPITIEFTVRDGDTLLKEDSVSLASADELFAYIAPGGDCEKMPPDLSEIQMILLPPKHPNITNPIADRRVTLQLGLVLITGPLSEIVQVAQELIDKMGRGELSEAFLAAAGVPY